MASQRAVRTWDDIWTKLTNLVGYSRIESPFGVDQSIVIDEATAFYISPTGNDSGPGTLAQPWLTVQAAANYLKKVSIAAAITVNIAAGTYVGDTAFEGLRFTSRSGSLTITGPTTWTTATLATGTATGTVTAYTAPVTSGTPCVLGLITDSGQAWTINALKGLYITITSGAQTGQRRLIHSNTATVINVGQSVTGLGAGITYTIEQPAVILNGRFDINNVTGILTTAAIIVSNVDITSSTASSPTVAMCAIQSIITDSAVYAVQFLESRLILTHINTFALKVGTARVRISNTYVAFQGTGAGFGVTADPGADIALRYAYLRVDSATTGGDALRLSGSSVSMVLGGISTIEATGSSTSGVVLLLSTLAPVTARFFSTVIRGTATRPLIDLSPSSGSFAPGNAYLENISFDTGLVGIKATGSSVVRINPTAGSPAFTACTTEIQMDATTSTYAAFNALSPKKIVGDFGTTLVQY